MEINARQAKLNRLASDQETGGLTQLLGLPYPSVLTNIFVNTYQRYCKADTYPLLDRFSIHLMGQISKDFAGSLAIGISALLLSVKVHKLIGPLLILAPLVVVYKTMFSPLERLAQKSPPRSQINSPTASSLPLSLLQELLKLITKPLLW